MRSSQGDSLKKVKIMRARRNKKEAEKSLAPLIEFRIRSLWEVTNLLSKGMAFYIAIMTALIGYILTKNRGLLFIKRVADLWYYYISAVFYCGYCHGMWSVKKFAGNKKTINSYNR